MMLTLKEDKLNRTELIEHLFALFNNFGDQNGQGLTMTINGKYGSGKSTLLNFIEEKNNTTDEFNIIKYNAWENNFFDNPLIPILHTISELKSTGGKIKNVAMNVVKKLPSMLLSTLANAHSIDLQPLCVNESIFEEYDSYKNALEEFKKVLKEYCSQKKTILLVDELDRCLPEYQIKVLENLYHLLNVPDLIVVIALDKNQLEHAIHNKFGQNLDTFGYLSKFIQYEIDLPDGNTYSYVKQLLNFSEAPNDQTKTVIADMFKSAELSVRECQNLIRIINLICNENSTIYPPYWYTMLVTFLVILKSNNSAIFKKYFGNSKDKRTPWSSRKSSINLLVDSKYKEFLTDIENTDIKKIINYLKSTHQGQNFLLYLINSFDSIRNIDTDSLADYTNSTADRVTHIIDGPYGMDDFPDIINKLILKLQILK